MSLPVKRLRSAWWFAGWAFLVSLPLFATADEWPQWRGPQADGVWRETGVVEKFAGPEVPIVWRQPIGAGYTGPTVAQGRVYVMDRITKPAEVERVLCFDEATGKPLWKHEYPTSYGRIGYPAGPRACVTLHEGAAYALGAAGMLHCLEAASGKVLWRVESERAVRNCHADLGCFGITRHCGGEGDPPCVWEEGVHCGARPPNGG